MLEAPIPPDDDIRCEDLFALDLLDTPQEERFDRITRLTKKAFGVSIVLISLVDKDRQWFKSRQGLEVTQTPRSISFCGHAIASDAAFVVEDTWEDERFADNPLVLNDPRIRFYAGQPLHSPGGQRVGTLCLIDYAPRRFSGDDRNQLRDLALMVESEFRRNPRLYEEPKKKSGWRARAGKNAWLEKLLNVRYLSAPMAALVATLCVLAVLTGGVVWDFQQLENYRTTTERNTLQRLSLLRGSLESSLNAKLHLVHAISGYIHSGGEISDTAFTQMAEELAYSVGAVRSLQLAPGGVVTHVWPEEANRRAVGHDLFADPQRRAAAERAIDARQIWIAGPLNLIQGGQALIARLPVFISVASQEQFWGFATALIDMPQLWREVGLVTADEQYRYALRGRDALGALGESFFGDPAVFNAAPVSAEITLPAGSWELAMIPKDGWPTTWPGEWTFRLGVFCVAALVWLLVYFLMRLPASVRFTIERSTEALERSESRFRDAMEALPDGIVIYDAQDRLVACNEHFRQLYEPCRPCVQPGRTFAEVVRFGLQRGLLKHVDPGSSQSVEEALKRAVEQHRNPPESYEVTMGNGTEVRVVERRMRDGGMVSFHMDITRDKANETALVEAREHAEQANQAKSAFLATISHEVRTPLNGVLGLLSIVQEDRNLSDEQKEYLSTAHQSARHLLEILNEILDLSKLEADRLELDIGAFPLADTLRGAVQLVQGQAKLKGLDLRLQIADELDCIVRGDHGRLRQVLLNLLSNAIKFTDRGRVSLHAFARKTTEQALDLQIEVEDSGIGFEPDEAEQLFETFTQLDRDRDRRFTGTGLGLAICKSLVELMGGEISAFGQPGQGAKFILNLTLPRERTVAGVKAIEKTAVVLPRELDWPPVRVLLAEDSPTNQMVIEAMLKNTGYVVDVVANGKEAVEAASRLPYDVILMDVYMPEMDGLSATRAIRLNGRQRDIPIIALTANAMQGDEQRFIEAGMDAYLAKPVNKQDLLEALYEAVHRRVSSTTEKVFDTRLTSQE